MEEINLSQLLRNCWHKDYWTRQVYRIPQKNSWSINFKLSAVTTQSIKSKPCSKIWSKVSKSWLTSNLNSKVDMALKVEARSTGLSLIQRSSLQVIGHFKKYPTVPFHVKWKELKMSSVNSTWRSSKTEKLFGYTTTGSFNFRQITFQRTIRWSSIASKPLY